MKRAAIVLAATLAASSAHADVAQPQIIETSINHINTDAGRVSRAVLNRGAVTEKEPVSFETRVGTEQACAQLAFTAAMANGRATVMCFNADTLVQTYMYEKQRDGKVWGGWLRF